MTIRTVRPSGFDVQVLGCPNRSRLAPLILALVLSGCSKVQDRYVVDVAGGGPVAGHLKLCGSVTPMAKSGNRWTSIRNEECEGDGRIVLRYADGTVVNCAIGYVTTGWEEHWRFVVRNRTCDSGSVETRGTTLMGFHIR